MLKGLGSSQVDELMEIIGGVLQENIGTPSIFTTAEAVREWLVDNNTPGQDGSMYAGEITS